MTLYRRWHLTLAAIALIAMTACSQPSNPPPPTIEVVVVPAEQTDFSVYGEYVATTRASLDVQVRARVEGFVEQMSFAEGSRVSEDDILYRIDDRPYQARVSRLKARLQSAEALHDKASRDVARLQPLYEQDAASQLDLDTAIAAEQDSAAGVAAAKAELREAELELNYTEVRAPISGLVGASNVDIGALVGPGGESLLTTIKQADPMFIEFHMSALDYLNARRRKDSWLERQEADESGRSVDGHVVITLPDDSRYEYLANIDFTDPQVDPQTGTFDVRASVPNPKRVLLPGQYTRARLELEVIPNAVVIDERTIQIEQGGSYVMVVMPDNTVERRFVIPGERSGGKVVIASGLSAGENVVTEGMHKVSHGQPVVPLSQQAYEARLEEERAEAANNHREESAAE